MCGRTCLGIWREQRKRREDVAAGEGPNDIQIYYYLKSLKVALGGLYNRVGFAQQYDVAFGEHGTLRRRLDDGLLVRLDDGVHLCVGQTTVGDINFLVKQTPGTTDGAATRRTDVTTMGLPEP